MLGYNLITYQLFCLVYLLLLH